MGEDNLEFNPNYDYKNILIGNYLNNKKAYSNDYYIILPGFSKTISFGSEQKFSFYLKKKGEIFGDALSVNVMEDMLDLFIYNQDNVIENILSAEQTDLESGEITVQFDKWTFKSKGVYTFKLKVGEYIVDNTFEIIVK